MTRVSVWVSLGQLLGGRVGVNDLSGPVGVASTMAVTARANIRAFFGSSWRSSPSISA